MRVLCAGEPSLLAAAADLLGYEPAPAAPEREEAPAAIGLEGPPASTDEPPRIESAPLVDVPFWRVEGYQAQVEAGLRKEGPGRDGAADQWEAVAPPSPRPLAALSTLHALLRRSATELVETRSPDLGEAVDRICRGRLIDRLPRRKRRRWGDRVQVIQDRSQRLVSYWQDQDEVCAMLRRLYPRQSFEHAAVYDGLAEPVFTGGPRRYEPPTPGALVIVLGDLGALDRGTEAGRRPWVQLGRRLRLNGNRVLALMPCPPDRWPADVAREWRLEAWEHRSSAVPRGERRAAEARARRLLRLVSPAIRIEPGLLRAVRLLLPEEEADAGTEADAWQHAAVISRSCVGATLDPQEAQQLRGEFDEEPEDLRRRVLALVQDWHADLPREIWYEEVACLSPASRGLLRDRSQVRQAAQYLEHTSDALSGSSLSSAEHAATLAWAARQRRRVPDAACLDPLFGPPLRSLQYEVLAKDPEAELPSWFDPTEVKPPEGPILCFHVRQQAGQLSLQPWPADPMELPRLPGSPLGHIRLRRRAVRVVNQSFWQTGEPPEWASEWGEDGFGPWVSFELAGVRQRLRWISPGTFMMGSPDDEPERLGWEGPRHKVRIAQGFWMLDTAVTQGLWQAVMGNNPSGFKGEERPVENVSWDDCQQFLKRINARVPGLDLALPTEAQWEYACRAGTETAFSFGDNITPEQVNYDGNYPYAGGRKGRYREETVEVASLPANAWGLYEMHGNVDEWCLDGRRDYRAEVEDDPIGPTEKGADRVVRGGDWDGGAQGARSAFRFAVGPGGRGGGLGFRCARVQAGAEPAGRSPGWERAKPQPDDDQPSGAVCVSIGEGGQGSMALPSSPGMALVTDCETLNLGRVTRPPWATAIGRDPFGLWGEIEFDGVVQRLRWIPPGRFLMGSPPDEAGRFDNEGPRHEVTLTRGFWLFDTPVTQGLWQAATGGNPSRFRSPDRPVEQVSWEDCQEFLDRLNGRIPGLELALPTEAQWECACRAGTDTATYAGDMEILGRRNAPALDPIAWYGGNSGVDFELENGYDSSDWPEKQYEHTQAGTRPVARKAPNPWGLYDMLGNVWEWCLDGRREYRAEAEVNPIGTTEEGAVRAVRGGDWYDYAQRARSAYRLWLGPGIRDDDLGFRCARAQGELGLARSATVVAARGTSQPDRRAAPK